MKDLRWMSKLFLTVAIVTLCGLPLAIMSQNRDSIGHARDFDELIESNSHQFMEQGRKTFRFDTFGDEAFWGDSLKLHQAIAKVSPRTALSV